jgi:hypothetical protein
MLEVRGGMENGMGAGKTGSNRSSVSGASGAAPRGGTGDDDFSGGKPLVLISMSGQSSLDLAMGGCVGVPRIWVTPVRGSRRRSLEEGPASTESLRIMLATYSSSDT